MGYDLTIVRSVSGAKVPITEKEIRDISHLPEGVEFTLDDFGNYVFTNSNPEGQGCMLSLSDGELWANVVGKNDIRFMIYIACLLEARVRDENYQTYKGVDEVYIHEDDVKLCEKQVKFRLSLKRKIMLKSVMAKFSVVIFFVLIGLLVKMFFGLS